MHFYHFMKASYRRRWTQINEKCTPPIHLYQSVVVVAPLPRIFASQVSLPATWVGWCSHLRGLVLWLSIVHKCIHACMHPCIHASIHRSIHPYTPISPCIHTSIQPQSSIYACMHVSINASIPASILYHSIHASQMVILLEMLFLKVLPKWKYFPTQSFWNYVSGSNTNMVLASKLAPHLIYIHSLSACTFSWNMYQVSVSLLC